uniref:Uncharacterized protein n=1 Tax=Knipowitschia caucasica TaxID=637954 RepID=A0AAV2KNE2_KNICA
MTSLALVSTCVPATCRGALIIRDAMFRGRGHDRGPEFARGTLQKMILSTCAALSSVDSSLRLNSMA